MMVAALTFSSSDFIVSFARQTTDDRLQNSFGFNKISAQGLQPMSSILASRLSGIVLAIA